MSTFEWIVVLKGQYPDSPLAKSVFDKLELSLGKDHCGYCKNVAPHWIILNPQLLLITTITITITTTANTTIIILLLIIIIRCSGHIRYWERRPIYLIAFQYTPRLYELRPGICKVRTCIISFSSLKFVYSVTGNHYSKLRLAILKHFNFVCTFF